MREDWLGDGGNHSRVKTPALSARSCLGTPVLKMKVRLVGDSLPMRGWVCLSLSIVF